MPHIHEKFDFTSTVYIVYKGKVLLRKHEKYHIWIGVGGHVELDEEPNQAAVREAKEEVGLDIKLIHPHKEPTLKDYSDITNSRQLIPPAFMNLHKINEVHSHIDLVFAATSDSNNVVPEQKGDEWKWMSVDEVEKDGEISDRVKNYAKTAISLASRK
ncbi:MAG: NUDIX domain-containing protein [Candidatus Pacebacteria bacterium]|nr:NUDIX domain-containing protein [Candidatus Paceibacterota bacterium]